MTSLFMIKTIFYTLIEISSNNYIVVENIIFYINNKV